MISHDDVADPHRDADAAGALDLRSADLDRIAVTDVVLDGRCQPGGRDIEVDRTGPQTPPQHGERTGEDDQKRSNDNSQALDPALADRPSPQRGKPIAKAMQPGIRL